MSNDDVVGYGEKLPNKLRAKFFSSDSGQEYVEISAIGDPCTSIQKVTPRHIAQFAADWDAYKRDAKEIDPGGTPITEVPGVDKNLALGFRLKGVRNAEELAGLDEAAAKSLGMSGYTVWQAAKNLIKLKQLEAMQDLIQQAPRRGRPPNKVETVEPALEA